MKVFVLTAEATGPEPGDYDGTTSVHATLAGALARFDSWLDQGGFDKEMVHYSDVTLANFLGGDPDPDLLDGVEMHWGINKSEVRE